MWWSEQCSRVVAERRYARRQLEKYPSDENIKKYKLKSAIAKKICKKAKSDSFHNYIESIKYDTPTGVIWRKINSLKTGRGSVCMSLEINGVPICDSVDKANNFANYMKDIADSGNIGVKNDFNMFNGACKNQDFNAYNQEINMGELKRAIQESKVKSPGIDGITFHFLKNLPENRLQELLNIINQSFMTGNVPQSWKLGMVIPILKPGKPKNNISSYRPISLLSCIGKTAERIIQNRLEYIVHNDKLLDKSQFGFRKGEGTMDVHIRLEYLIKNCLASKETCIVVYIDLSSAFDVVWPEGLIMKLIDKGINGKMIAWLYNYLCNRCIKAKVDGYFSDAVEIKAGTPQGAVLSPLLFNFMVSDIPDDRLVKKHSYADDITFTCSGADVADITKAMQNYLKVFMAWAKKWGIQINFKKTYMQYFTRRKIKCPIIRINNKVIEYKKVHKLLGLYYDSPLLSWKSHIDYLHADCLKRLDIMKAISSVNFGASCKILRMFYIAYIRAKLDYGSIFYSSAAKSNLKKLDLIQNACARLILGARKSSPIVSLQTESGLPALEMHRGKLSVKALIKLCCKPHDNGVIEWCGIENTALNNIGYCGSVNSFINRAFLWSRLLNVQVQRVATKVDTEIPPWQNGLNIVTTYNEDKIYNNDTFIDYLTVKYPEYSTCYTDGSKIESSLKSVGSGVYFPMLELGFTYRLNPDHSVVYSELYGIMQALLFIKKYTVENCYIF